MRLDLSLPIVVFAAAAIAIGAYPLCEGRMKALYKHERLKTQDIIFLIIAFSTVITITALAPQLALQVFFVTIYSVGLFLFTYTVWPKWYVAPLLPVTFILLYLYHWTIVELSTVSYTHLTLPTKRIV